jgi:hypothetical protein
VTEEQVTEMLDKVRAQLAEHFDAIQIHVSWLNPDGTTSMRHRGSGNYYARVGMSQDFCLKEQAEVLADELARNEET